MGATYRCTFSSFERVGLFEIKKAPLGIEIPRGADSRQSRFPLGQYFRLQAVSAKAVTVAMTLSSSSPTPSLVRVTTTSQPVAS